jgi:hypothetical protein
VSAAAPSSVPCLIAAEANVGSRGFKNKANFDAYIDELMYLIAQAVYAYEPINAHPDSPANCYDCGKPLSRAWVEHLNGAGPGILCQHCTDIDPEQRI